MYIICVHDLSPLIQVVHHVPCSEWPGLKTVQDAAFGLHICWTQRGSAMQRFTQILRTKFVHIEPACETRQKSSPSKDGLLLWLDRPHKKWPSTLVLAEFNSSKIWYQNVTLKSSFGEVAKLLNICPSCRTGGMHNLPSLTIFYPVAGKRTGTILHADWAPIVLD